MTTDLQAQHDALVAMLDTIDIAADNYFTMSPNAPCAVIHPNTIPATELMGAGLRQPAWTITLLAGVWANSPETTTATLYDWISTGTATSVLDALNDKTKLVGYSASSATVATLGPTNWPDGNVYLAADVTFDLF